METQKTPNSKSNLEKEKWSWRNQTPQPQTVLQSYSDQNGTYQHKNRNTDQRNRIDNPKTNLYAYGHLKEARIYHREKAVSSISGAGKTGQIHVKE